MNIATALAEITYNIEKVRGASPISAPRVALLAASKSQSIDIIEEAILSGITNFGENRVQEAMDKWVSLKIKYPHIKLHLIGTLQTNKVKQALQLFDVVQSVDRVALAEAIAIEMKKWRIEELKNKEEKNSAIPQFLNSSIPKFYIQVNTGEEPQKSGIYPAQTNEFIKYCVNDLKLPVVGLMCVPPSDQPPAPHFALLRKIAISNNLTGLSMGMSGDYKEAVRMGATMVRLGTVLFGERN